MKFKNDVEIQNSDLTISNTGSARLVLNGDSNNSGDTGQEDAIIDFLGDNGAYGYRLNSENWSSKSAFNIQENRNGTYTSRLYIDNNGDVGIGTDSPGTKLEVAGTIKSIGTAPKLLISNTKNGTWTPGESLGLLEWYGADASGGGPRVQSSIDVVAQDQYGAHFNMLFKLSSGSGGNTELMRIKGTGEVGIGTTSPSYELDVVGDIRARGDGTGDIYSGTYGARLSNYYSVLTTNGEFWVGYAGGAYATCRASAFTVTSDYRLKEKIVPLTDSLDRLGQLNVYKFNWIDKPNEEPVDGFIAHEVAEVIPEAVVGVKDKIGPDGKPEYQGLDQAKIVPLLTAALQQAIDKIEALEVRINKLENK